MSSAANATVRFFGQLAPNGYELSFAQYLKSSRSLPEKGFLLF